MNPDQQYSNGQYPAPQPADGQPFAVPPQPPSAPASSQATQPNSTPPAQQLAQSNTNPNSTQNTLLVAEIRDGIVIMQDGSFRAVVLTKSINFDLMSPQERESVEFSYQGFLNSLYFPIQIFIRSQKVDIRPYLDKLDKIRSEQDNMLLALLMEDYLNFISALADETNIMDKRFYITVPYYPTADAAKAVMESKKLFGGLFGGKKQSSVTINEADLEKAKTELRNRVQAVLNGLLQVGVQAVPLDTQELIELYYDAYNPDTATRQHLKNFDDLSVPIVTKGEGTAPQPDLDTGGAT